MNRIALCIPAYNAAAYLPRLLRSAENQIIPFDQVLVYNDCSTDNTSEVAKQFGAMVIEGDVNRGCSFGKNKLAEVSECDWIHFHDADDELMYNFTQLARQWIARVDCPDVVLFNYKYVDNDTNELLGVSSFNDQELQGDPVRYTILNQINPFCGLYRRSRLMEVGGYDLDPEILYNEDVAFHCKLAIAGLSFGAEEEFSIVNYRVGNSMSLGNQLRCAQAHFEVMRRNADKVGNRYPREIAKKLWKNAIVCASLNDRHTSKKAARLAFELDPTVLQGEKLFVKVLSSIKPEAGVLFREKLIRTFKPTLRR